jgi:GPH family glycoside/pentoside/hexuronide:cation symporter
MIAAIEERVDACRLTGWPRQRLLIFFALGDSGTGLAATLMGFYLFVFYTSAADLPGWLAGIVLMVGRFAGAFSDPAVGRLCDATRSRWGSRIPWMLMASIPFGISMLLLWWMPAAVAVPARTAVFLLISFASYTLYTCINLPYSSLASDLTQDDRFRTRLNTARFTGSVLSGLVAITLGALFVDNYADPSAYFRLACVAAPLIVVVTLISALGMAPYCKTLRKPIVARPVRRSFVSLLRGNQRFRYVIVIAMLLMLAIQIMQAASLIYLPVVVRLPESLSTWVLLPFEIGMLIGLRVVNLVVSRSDLSNAFKLGAAIWIIGSLLAMFMPPVAERLGEAMPLLGQLHLLLVVAAITLVGFGASVAYLIPWSMLPGAIDGDPDTGAGQYTAWMVFGQKVYAGLAIFVFGLLISLAGYSGVRGLDQPPLALLVLRACMGLIPVGLTLLALGVMRRWRRLPAGVAIG